MKELDKITNPFGDDKVIANCGLFGMMSTKGRRFSGQDAILAMANMHDRGNGLGGGFAAYGIYPEYADCYALHVMYESMTGKEQTEHFMRTTFDVVHNEEIPHRDPANSGVAPAPILWRYFVRVPKNVLKEISISRRGLDGGIKKESPRDGIRDDIDDIDDIGRIKEAIEDNREDIEDDYVVKQVMTINTGIADAYVFSSGKNMGVFKGVGYPEDIGNFFCLEEYNGYLWTAHGRFPTNTQAWWGGAHPFSLLDWTVVHNGEISSYGTNRAFLEMHGYYCCMHTDTEVIAYAVDLLARRHHLPMDIVAKVLAPPLWVSIDRMPEPERRLHTALRLTYPALLMNGPFTIIIARQGEMIGLRDRIQLRPLVAGIKDDMLYLSSEEAPIRVVCPDLDETWTVKGGEPIIGRLGGRGITGFEGFRGDSYEELPSTAVRGASGR